MHARSKRLLFTVVLGMAVVFGAAESLIVAKQSSASASEDLVLGTWNLNLAKSTYSPGPAPKSQKRIYEATPDGLKATILTTYADGHSTTVQYTAKYDSVEYPLTGSPDWDRIGLKKVNAYTAEANLAHAGKELGIARRVISQDGKTMTITFRATVEGQPAVNNVAVYEKEK